MTAVLHPAFLTRFVCLGDTCEDTCCQGWNMQVDAPTDALYRERAPELLDAVTGDEGARVMKRDPKTDYCVKFDAGWCGIQKAMGAQYLSDACHFYPRAARRVGGAVAATAALSCPEIARLTLLADDAFVPSGSEFARLPQMLTEYLPEGMTEAQATQTHQAFMAAALEESVTPARSVMRMVIASQALPSITKPEWQEAAPFYLQHSDSRIPAPQAQVTDPFYLLQALCGLIAAAKKAHSPRLMQTVHEMEAALHVTIQWDTLAIAHLLDSHHAAATLYKEWREGWGADFAPLLRRYLAAQLSLAFFPFGGFGRTLDERAAIIGVRFATVQLALMSLCRAANGKPAEADVIRAIQSLSRFLDHLADPEFTVKIYGETGWLAAARLRALVGDA